MRALRFLLANAFVTPAWIVDPEISRRSEPGGNLSRVHAVQSGVLKNLLSSVRLARLIESEQIDGSSALSATVFLSLLRKGIWSELDEPRGRIDAYRRDLQRTYLEIAGGKNAGEERALYRAELRALRAQIGRALPKAGDDITRAHLHDAIDQIDKMLNSRLPDPPVTPAVTPRALVQ